MLRKRSSARSAKPLLLVSALLCLASCGVRRAAHDTTPGSEHYQWRPGAEERALGSSEPRTTTPAKTPELGRQELLQKLQEAPSYASVQRGSLNATLKLGAREFSTKINATIISGRAIYWSVIPFPLIEAARVWINTEGVTVLDRLGGRYAQVSFSELSEQLGFPLSYEDIEYLLLGKLSLGKEPMKLEEYKPLEDAKSYARFASRKHVLEYILGEGLQPEEARYFRSPIAAQALLTARYSFTDPSLGRPEETNITLQRKSPSSLSIDWSRLKPYEGSVPDLSVKLKPSYQRIELSELMKMISKL